MYIRQMKGLLYVIGVFALLYYMCLLLLDPSKLDAHNRYNNEQQFRHRAFKKSQSKLLNVSVIKAINEIPINTLNVKHTEEALVENGLQTRKSSPEGEGIQEDMNRRAGIDRGIRRRQRIQMQPLLADFDSSHDDMDETGTILSWEQEQAKRVHTMRQGCRSLSPRTTPLSTWLKSYHVHLRHILVSDKYKILYCYVPKAACTNWKKAFLILNNFTADENEARLMAHQHKYLNKTTLAGYSEEEALFRLQNYSKFIFIRNPTTRVLSAYREKFAVSERRGRRKWSINLGNAIHFQFGNHTITNFKNIPKNGYNVSFPEFVRYLGSRRARFDLPGAEHWKPYSNLCFPCHVEYDAIGKFETFDFDAKQILRNLKREDLQNVVLKKSDHSTGSSSSELLQKYYSQLTRSEIASLNWRYRIDLALFGYAPFK